MLNQTVRMLCRSVILAIGLVLWGCSDVPIEDSIINPDQSVLDGSAEEERQAAEIIASAEFKELARLQTEGVTMLIEAMNRGVPKEALTSALKEDLGLVQDPVSQADDVASQSFGELLSNGDSKRGDRLQEEIRVASQALLDKYPILVTVQEQDGFAEQCELTEARVERFFTMLDSSRGDGEEEYNLSALPSLLSAMGTRRVGDGDCEACGGSCAAMLRTLACIGVVGVLSGWNLLALGVAAWHCGCDFCPMDLPKWMC